MVNSNICIIPARGGSQRIHKKNIVPLNGQPMIAWTIQAAKASNLFKRIIVSTDDEEIAKISMQYGAEVPFLRKKYNDDHSPVSLATLNSLYEAEAYYQEKYDRVIQLMANCPLRTASDIQKAYDNFIEKNNDFQINVSKFGWMNPWWALMIGEDGEPKQLFNDEMKARSQDLSKLYCPTGAIWIAKTAALKKEKTFYGNGYKLFEMDWIHAIDIDEKEELTIAETFMGVRPPPR